MATDDEGNRYPCVRASRTPRLARCPIAMKPSRGGGACALVVGALVALCGSAAARADVSTIQESTAIGGASTGYAALTVPRPMRPLNEDQPTYGFSGGGGFLGIVLRAEQSLPRSTQHPQFELLRLGPSNGDGAVFSGVSDGSGSGSSTLPAGAYRLYLITADQGQVALDFPTLPAGELTLAPAVLTPFWAGALPTLPWSTALTTVFGRADEVVSQGLVFERVIVRHPAVGQRLEMCSYYGSTDQHAGSSAYTNGCPGGTSTFSGTATSTGDIGEFSLTFVNSPGRFGVGGNLSVPLVALDQPGALETYGMWMSYDQPPGSSSAGGGSSGSMGGPPGGSAGSSVIDTGPTGTSKRDHRPVMGDLSVSARTVRVRGRRAIVGLRCSKRAACSGTVRILGWTPRSRFVLRPGQQRNVRLTIFRARAKRLTQRRRVRVVLEVRSRLPNGISQQRTPVILLSAPKPR